MRRGQAYRPSTRPRRVSRRARWPPPWETKPGRPRAA
jgi:hypothetical protein